jgi:hypothetical protein
MDMRFGTWNVRSMYRAGSLRAIAEVTGDWRKQHNEELYRLYSSPSIIKMIKSRRMSVLIFV